MAAASRLDDVQAVEKTLPSRDTFSRRDWVLLDLLLILHALVPFCIFVLPFARMHSSSGMNTKKD
eukprot:4262267-Amphidinium_carterae.1